MATATTTTTSSTPTTTAPTSIAAYEEGGRSTASGFYRDMYQTHSRRTYGAYPFKRGRVEVEGEEELSSSPTGEKLYIANEDSAAPIFPDGERGFPLGSGGRFASVKTFGDTVFVSIREFFSKENEEGILQWYPTKKGIHLRTAEWKDLIENVREIDEHVVEAENQTRAKMEMLESRFVKNKRNVLPHPSDRPTKRIRPTPAYNDY